MELRESEEKSRSTLDENEYKHAFRRWLVREIESGRMSRAEVLQTFEFGTANPDKQLSYWMKRYCSSLPLTLPQMSRKEKQKTEVLEQQLKALEKQLEDTQMKNAALETMIDVAEAQLRISIRKKSGPKQ